MPVIRVLFLWHMHQPYYKDLVTGEYRLPWVRLHGLKDYYGMVKLLDEFPAVHQTFNLVPSLIQQLQEYVAGVARDPFFDVAARPAGELNEAQRAFALQYLFQANLQNMIGRYSRFRELWEHCGNRHEDVARAAAGITDADLTDLQVLSQLVWFDEFYLEEPEIRELVRKGRNYSQEDQNFVMAKQRELLSRVLPAYSEAARRGSIEISTSPFYHPILPLLCDTDAGAVSHPGLPLPTPFRHPEDAREQICRGLELHKQVFGIRPVGMWPSEGSVSDEVLSIAHELGIQWIATDEGVLGRSLGFSFQRDGAGNLSQDGASNLYRSYRWERDSASVNLVFRDHALSDLIGFVYSGMPPAGAAADFIRRLKDAAAPMLSQGRDAVIPVILDGENAWESYQESGREFLRRLYESIQSDGAFEALTVSEGVSRTQEHGSLNSVVPGSWINANFDVWIGAREDNLAWDHLSAARDFYAQTAGSASAEGRELAMKELLIAEGSDWNWWYGPEHHSANDAEFDELYRKHLSNVYQALGAAPPDVLAQPIQSHGIRPSFTQQTAYIHPQISGTRSGYFDWLGAATHFADRRSSAMHGKLALLDTAYAGIDEENLYCRLDFVEPLSSWSAVNPRLVLSVTIEQEGTVRICRLESEFSPAGAGKWSFSENGNGSSRQPAGIAFRIRNESILEAAIPLPLLGAAGGSVLRLRFSLWQDQLPLDAIPQEGSLELRVVPENELSSLAYAKP